jgi:hypothetical protein
VTTPSQLPATYSGGILKVIECFDLDSGGVVADARSDICMDANGLVSARNGAVLSQTGGLIQPSKNTCKADQWMDTSELSPMTDLYMCFKTNQGSYGFFIMRIDQLMDRKQIVFDWCPPLISCSFG